ncbi:MAG: hypothetical protein WBV45_00965 [Lutimonas sp.]
MKDDFEIRGYFYRLEDINCRKYLDIKRKDTFLENPDLLVVMMNPGNSKPLDGMYTGKEESEACPDRTQMQIMHLMKNCDLSYCRILNLTDIQESKSSILYKILSKRKIKKMAHSIFDPRRQAEFNELYPKGTRTIFAWGVHEALTELAQVALDRVGEENTFGLKKGNLDTAYYHPLPPNYFKQQNWINQISKQLNNS